MVAANVGSQPVCHLRPTVADRPGSSRIRRYKAVVPARAIKALESVYASGQKHGHVNVVAGSADLAPRGNGNGQSPFRKLTLTAPLNRGEEAGYMIIIRFQMRPKPTDLGRVFRSIDLYAVWVGVQSTVTSVNKC